MSGHWMRSPARAAGDAGAAGVAPADARVGPARDEVVADVGRRGALDAPDGERAEARARARPCAARGLGRARAALAHLPDAPEARVVQAAGDLGRDQIAEVHAHDRVGPGRRRHDQIARRETRRAPRAPPPPSRRPSGAQRGRDERHHRLDQRQQRRRAATAASADARGAARSDCASRRRFHGAARLAHAPAPRASRTTNEPTRRRSLPSLSAAGVTGRRSAPRKAPT